MKILEEHPWILSEWSGLRKNEFGGYILKVEGESTHSQGRAKFLG